MLTSDNGTRACKSVGKKITVEKRKRYCCFSGTASSSAAEAFALAVFSPSRSTVYSFGAKKTASCTILESQPHCTDNGTRACKSSKCDINC